MCVCGCHENVLNLDVRLKRINKETGFFSSANFPNGYNSGTVQQWKVHCFHDEYVAIIITHMDLPEGDYLQVEDDRCSGKSTHLMSKLITKDSAGVIFSGEHGNSSHGNNSHGFECAFVCIGECIILTSNGVGDVMGLLIDQDKRVWTESFLNNKAIMEIIQVNTVCSCYK